MMSHLDSPERYGCRAVGLGPVSHPLAPFAHRLSFFEASKKFDGNISEAPIGKTILIGSTHTNLSSDQWWNRVQQGHKRLPGCRADVGVFRVWTSSFLIAFQTKSVCVVALFVQIHWGFLFLPRKQRLSGKEPKFREECAYEQGKTKEKLTS